MDLLEYNNDEYQPCEQGNKFAPIHPFRLVVSGSSDSGKTFMIINLLMGDKKVKEDGQRYILCNDAVLIGKHLDEPKWKIVENFFNELAQTEDVSFQSFSPENIPDVLDFDPSRSTVVIFEDLVNESKKIQEQIASYFTHGRHRNISPIYTSQRFFAIYKTIRDNASHISLHRGSGSLADTKRIISQYTEHSNKIAPIIDDLTLKREFIVFDLRRPRDDPLSIRVRWDTSLRLFLDQSKNESGSINVASLENHSKFSNYGQQAVAEAKKNNALIEFAQKLPSPAERKILLKENVSAKNSDIWARYVFREAFGIDNKDLGPEWIKFSEKIGKARYAMPEDSQSPVVNREAGPHYTIDSQLLRYKTLLEETKPLDNKKFIEACEILLWLFTNDYIDRKTLCIGFSDLST